MWLKIDIDIKSWPFLLQRSYCYSFAIYLEILDEKLYFHFSTICRLFISSLTRMKVMKHSSRQNLFLTTLSLRNHWSQNWHAIKVIVAINIYSFSYAFWMEHTRTSRTKIMWSNGGDSRRCKASREVSFLASKWPLTLLYTITTLVHFKYFIVPQQSSSQYLCSCSSALENKLLLRRNNCLNYFQTFPNHQ